MPDFGHRERKKRNVIRIKHTCAYFEGYDKGTEFCCPIQCILLDPLAWKAVGKVLGWPTEDDEDRSCHCGACGYYKSYANEWKENMHRMIEDLCEGKTITEFLETVPGKE